MFNALSFNNFGIIASYLWLIVSIYVFDWQPFGVSMTFLVEYLVLILIYFISEIIRYKSFDAFVENNIMTKCLVLFLFGGSQLFVAFVTQEDMREKLSSDFWAYLDYNFFIAFITMIISYAFRIKKMAAKGKIHTRVEENVVFQILALAFMNFGALGFLGIFGNGNAKLVITSAICARIGLELMLVRHIKTF